jgi:hypothetical protein
LIKQFLSRYNKFKIRLNDGYKASYGEMIEIQQLSELEEIIEYKTTSEEKIKNLTLKKWKKRLNGVEKVIKYQEKILILRALAIPYTKNVYMNLKFSKLCRESKNLKSSISTLYRLKNFEGNYKFILIKI